MTTKLSSVGEVISGHTFRGAIPHDKDGNYAVVQAKNINKDGTIDNNDLERTIIEKMRSKGTVQDGDVLLSNRGTFRSAVYRGDDTNVIVASSLYILRVQQSDLLPEYLMVFLNSPLGQQHLGILNRGTIIQSIPRQSLLSLDVPVPTIKKQHTAISIYQNYHSRIALYERKTDLHEQVANHALSLLLTHS
ncbi:restriction endonuclease subunit S [Patescibacteria group bacterium]|nr:restriction endonuclease subunit S [Patescibacteria group bacterium]MBU1123737.1 restriction endonuclease subunit S [Patescibacteria group bacterium]MBU1911550.1 restriction endonuclease subunit S [Patescibacteria group bacterium]